MRIFPTRNNQFFSCKPPSLHIFLRSFLSLSPLIFLCPSSFAQVRVQSAPIADTASPDSVISSPAGVGTAVKKVVSDVVSGDLSAAEHGATLDRFLVRTFCRISDCVILGRQELILTGEYAKLQVVETAEKIYQKTVDTAAEHSRDAILNRLIPSQNNNEKP